MTKGNKECFDAVINQMREVLNSNNDEKGNSWRFMDENELVDKLMLKMYDFQMSDEEHVDEILIDMMNYCYLIWAKRKFFKGV
jgi:hypothetical protein